MEKGKSYGQFCALARALDEVGDRWTLLVLRELMIAPAGYSALLGRLPGVATNLLAERLGRLQRAGLVIKQEDGRTYELTPRGLGLKPVLHELIRWGAPLMKPGPGSDHVEDAWALLALEALLTSREVTGPPAVVSVVCGDTALQIELSARGRRVTQGDCLPADAQLEAGLADVLLAASTGVLTRGIRVEGDASAARRAVALSAGGTTDQVDSEV